MATDVENSMPVIETESTATCTVDYDDTYEEQHKYTTARAIELITEALQLSSGLSRLTDRAKELERDLKEAIEKRERTDRNVV